MAADVVHVDLHALATNVNYLSALSGINTTEPRITLMSYNPDFQNNILGDNFTAGKVADLSWQAFHEAGIYHEPDNSIYITSNYVSLEDNINITIVSLDDYSVTSTQFPCLWEANGALLTTFLGRNFSSINDVRQHAETGDLWFTDADYGYFQHFRPPPTIPKQVYRFEPATGVVQVVADGFVQSNGLEFSPDHATLYVSDTGAAQFSHVDNAPSTIYAFDIVDSKRLANRRTFAFCDIGVPDGIHADMDGNVWAACGDGVHIFGPDGVLRGKIHLGEASNNFAFIPGGVLVFSNYRLWLVDNIKVQGREVCKDFGIGCAAHRPQKGEQVVDS